MTEPMSVLVRLVSAADVVARFSSRARAGFEAVVTDAGVGFGCGLGARLDDDANPPFMVVVAAAECGP